MKLICNKLISRFFKNSIFFFSFSSNSDPESQNKNENINYLLEARFWKPQKNIEINQEKKMKKNDKEKNGIREESNKQSQRKN